MSSKKVWYIFLGNHHKGPYTLSEIDSLILQGVAPIDVPIWKDGLEGWVSHSTLSKHIRDPEQSVPEIPTHLKLDYIDIPEIPSDAGKPKVGLPPRKVIPVENERKVTELGENIICQERDSDLDGLLGKSTLPLGKVFKYLAVVIILTVIVGGGTIYYKKFHHFSRPAELSLSDYRRLRTVFKGQDDHIRSQFALSTDSSKLWMSTNYPLESQLYLSARSIEGKIIGEQSVDFTSTSTVSEGLASFLKLTYTQGERLIPGKYLIKVRGDKNPKIQWWQKLLMIDRSTFTTEREVLIGFKNESQYFRSLKKYTNTKVKKKITLLTELQYKYQTLIAVANQLDERIKKLIVAKRDLRKIAKFEREYTTGFGAFLTSLIAQEQGELAIKLAKYSSMRDTFNQLHTQAGELANSSMEVVDGVKKSRWLNSKRRKQLNQMLDSAIQGCKKSCYRIIHDIQGELQNLKALLIE